MIRLSLANESRGLARQGERREASRRGVDHDAGEDQAQEAATPAPIGFPGGPTEVPEVERDDPRRVDPDVPDLLRQGEETKAVGRFRAILGVEIEKEEAA